MANAYVSDHKGGRSNNDRSARLESEASKRRFAEIIGLVERKLARMGLDSLRIVPLCVTDSALQIDLLSNRDEACRMEINRSTGVITQYDGLL